MALGLVSDIIFWPCTSVKYRLQEDQLDFRGTESNIIFMIISYDPENGFLTKTMIIKYFHIKIQGSGQQQSWTPQLKPPSTGHRVHPECI